MPKLICRDCWKFYNQGRTNKPCKDTCQDFKQSLDAVDPPCFGTMCRNYNQFTAYPVNTEQQGAAV